MNYKLKIFIEITLICSVLFKAGCVPRKLIVDHPNVVNRFYFEPKLTKRKNTSKMDLNSKRKGDSSDYLRSVPYLQAIGKTKYDTQYDFLPNDDELEFWDRFHLSPVGEKKYAKQLFKYLKDCSIFD